MVSFTRTEESLTNILKRIVILINVTSIIKRRQQFYHHFSVYLYLSPINNRNVTFKITLFVQRYSMP